MAVWYWVALGAVVAFAAAGAGWFLLVPRYRGWRHLNDRLSSQVSRSAALLRGCGTAISGDTGSGRLSTIR